MLLLSGLVSFVLVSPPDGEGGVCAVGVGGTAVAYGYSVAGHHGALDYGFLATPERTLCHFYGRGDSMGGLCDVARLTIRFSPAEEIAESPDPAVLLGAILRAARNPCNDGGRRSPGRYALVSVRAQADPMREPAAVRRLRPALALVERAIGRTPPDLDVVVKATIWFPSPTPSKGSPCDGRPPDPPANESEVVIEVQTADELGALQGDAVAPPPSRATLEQVLRMSETQRRSELGFHTPFITLAGCSGGKDTSVGVAATDRFWTYEESDALGQIFKELCAPSLIGLRKVVTAEDAGRLRSRSRCEVFMGQAEKQFDENMKTLEPKPP